MAALEKTEVVRARMNPEEVLMLKALAGKDETMSDVLRDLVRHEYRRRFGEVRVGRSAAPTLRGVIEDVAGPIHFTAGNVADRTGLPVRAILGVLDKLARWRLVERVDREGAESTWETLLPDGAERLLREAATMGFALDVDLRETPIKDWTPPRPVRAWGMKPEEKDHLRAAIAWAKGWTTPAPLLLERVESHGDSIVFHALDPEGRPFLATSLRDNVHCEIADHLQHGWIVLEGIDRPWVALHQSAAADGQLTLVLQPYAGGK